MGGVALERKRRGVPHLPPRWGGVERTIARKQGAPQAGGVGESPTLLPGGAGWKSETKDMDAIREMLNLMAMARASVLPPGRTREASFRTLI